MKQTRKFVESLGFPSRDSYDLPTSAKRFPDGAQYRFEIPSVEGPRCLQTVIEEAKKHKLTIHRVSQGSGILLQTDDEIKDMGMSFGYGPARDSRIRAPFDKRRTAAERSHKG